MYAIAGVSGHTGSVAAEELIRRGKRIRVIVRNPEKGAAWKARGAEVAIASMDDADAIGRALSGTEGAYLLSVTDLSSSDLIARAREVGDACAKGIRASGINHVVFLSSMGAQNSSGTGPVRGLHEIENRLGDTGIALTLLRPTYFLENWGSSLGPAQKDGVLPTFLPADFRFPQIATHDIGLAAAGALEQPPQGTRILELAGPADYTPSAIASIVGHILDREVNAVAAPLDAVVPTLMSFGMSAHVAGMFREMYEGLVNGSMTWDGAGERHRGTTTPEEVFRTLLSSKGSD